MPIRPRNSPGYSSEAITARAGELRDVVLPKLRGSVFHVTSRSGLARISSGGAIDTNVDGRFGETFPQSKTSFGRQHGYVCLFDLRNVAEEHLKWGLDCFYFLDPFHGRREDPAFLVLQESEYDRLIPWTATKDDYSQMWIPYVEAWYPHAVPLRAIRRVISVTVLRPPPSEFELAVTMARNANGSSF